MTFNSVQFAIFLAVVFPLHWTVRRRRWQNLVLLVASYYFYAYWDWRFLFLLGTTTLIDYFAVLRLSETEDERKRRAWMIFSVAVNLTVLGFFKYFNFFADSAVSFTHRIGINLDEPTLQIVLPVGISFYVFHEISYAVDVYRRRTQAERNFVVYAVFVAFFPQLVAGPITRAAHMLPQFRRDRRFPDKERLYSAGALIVSGLFKKVVLADGIAPYVNSVFDHPAGHGPITATIAAVGFSIQIYGDFAGYTDIARGVAVLFGIELARNFEQPYLSRNITEFWRTWHISLSTWLHDYLYVPLGGNRNGNWATYRNLMITMLLGGLWHGASWHFVVWGGLNGAALAIHRLRGGTAARGRPEGPTRADAKAIFWNFALVTSFWVFFRARSLGDAFRFFGCFFTLTKLGLGSKPGLWEPNFLLVAAFLVVMLAIDLVDRHRREWLPLLKWPAWQQGALAAFAIIAIIVFSGAAPTPFIYFQF